MLIRPTQSVPVSIKCESGSFQSDMLSLTETELKLSCSGYIEQGIRLIFHAKYFKGSGTIKRLEYNNLHFIYILEIENISFQPGLLINTRL